MKILQFAVAGALALAAFTGGALAQSGENILTVQLEDGPVVIELRPDIARSTSSRSRNWPRQANMTMSPFIVSSRASWPRPATSNSAT